MCGDTRRFLVSTSCASSRDAVYPWRIFSLENKAWVYNISKKWTSTDNYYLVYENSKNRNFEHRCIWTCSMKFNIFSILSLSNYLIQTWQLASYFFLNRVHTILLISISYYTQQVEISFVCSAFVSMTGPMSVTFCTITVSSFTWRSYLKTGH